MGRKHTNTLASRPQASKRGRHMRMTPEVDLIVRFEAARDRDREGMGR